MQLSKRIELYADTQIDFKGSSETNANKVILQDDSDGKGPYIKEWNIAGVKKPDITKLQDYQESEYDAKFPREQTDKERLLYLEEELIKLKAK